MGLSLDEDIIMRTVNFTPLNRSFIGFDQLTSLVEKANQQPKKSHSVPYNIESLDQSKYKITLAVAGFSEQQLEIEANNNQLTVTGKQNQANSEQTQFIHQGIKQTDFENKFQLGEHVKVVSANLESGLLTIDLEREVPEALKPRKVQIGSQENLVN
jgi:molecular chaperone IbpA